MKVLRHLPGLLLLLSAAAIARPAITEGEAIRRVVGAVHRFELTTLRDGCWEMDVTEQAARFELTVRERHTPACGGDPATGPRLFTVFVSKRDGRMTSDVYDGVSYRPLNRRLKRP
jgi:hypothetical protein